MKIRPTGVGFGMAGFSGSLNWEYVASNEKLVRRVFVFLEDRRVLTRAHYRDDYDHTRESADQIRKFLVQEIMNVNSGGPLESAFKAIRSASAAFIDAAGANSKTFRADHKVFQLSLNSYRHAVATQLAAISLNFKVPVPDELQPLMTEFDVSWYQG